MSTYRELTQALKELGIPNWQPVMVHAPAYSASDSDKTRTALDGSSTRPAVAETDILLGALIAAFQTLVVPTFTYCTMVIPEEGPALNGIAYGSGRRSNQFAEFYRHGLPSDRAMGALAEALRGYPRAQRSRHPLLSFAGLNAGPILGAQTLEEPLAPVGVMGESQGWVLLIGTDQRSNISIHYAERLAGRRQFTRWALTARRVVACNNIPGCSRGFEKLTARLVGVTRLSQAGALRVQAIPIADLLRIARAWIETDPLALLCDQRDCVPCHSVRAWLLKQNG